MRSLATSGGYPRLVGMREPSFLLCAILVETFPCGNRYDRNEASSSRPGIDSIYELRVLKR